MLTSNPLMDDDSEFQKLLMRRKSRDEKLDFFSETNSLFEFKNEDTDPFFFKETS